MGEVYRATDTRLGRDVALKVLPAEMASSPERIERFRREAKALAALDHPGIVTVFSVEEADGVQFLTMQLVDGEPLDRLIREGGLPVDRILEIATRLADALAAAHDKGIVHRDLKPANVMVTADGRVKVLDFGLARMSEAEVPGGSLLPTELLTREGVVMGTVPYMSPEQVSGLAVDPRSDLFSLGVILYEMATGRRPFGGRSSAELASAILRDPPPPLGELRADLPDVLRRAIERCLEKSVAERIASARELRETLRAPANAASLIETTLAPTSRAATAADSGAARTEEGFWVAVLPFKHSGTSPELTALADGLSEEILTGLSRFSYLRVIARSSTARYASDSHDVRAIGRKIGARYVMEGSLRQAGTMLRLTVQLVDTETGTHLWAENYQRTFSPEAVFELQDDLVPRIVSTVADTHGILPRSMAQLLRTRAPEELSPYEAVLRSFAYFERVSAEELVAARAPLEKAVERAPRNADAWALLALLCAQAHGQGFDLEPDSLARGEAAARRAVELEPSNHLAQFSLAQVLFFQKELETFRNAAQRAAALNPMDGNSIAFLGEMLVYSGDFERGLELAGRAKELNPHHPGWYWFADYYHFYDQGDYQSALEVALKMNMPNHWGATFAVAAACGQLGRQEAGRKAVRKLVELRPGIANSFRQDIEKWWAPAYVEHLIDGIRKAGLELSSPSETKSRSLASDVSAPHASDTGRASEGFRVAVLPFKTTGADTDLAALADGMTEEIVTGLSRFPWLRVVSRGVTSRFTDAAVDVRAVGREIGARYVMEGSLRLAGEQLRVAVKLVDATTGVHLWAETYDRGFAASEVFALQDDLVPRIVSTSADHFGVLARAISEAVRQRPAAELTPYEALMRGFGYHFRLSPEEHAQAREVLERAVEEAPDNADCWAMLSWIYSHEHAHGFNPRPGSLDRALDAARRAVDLAPSNHLAHQTLAVVLFFSKELAACLSACERALALNPLDASNEAIFLVTFMGDWERGRALISRAMELNPYHPGWYRTVFGLDEYRRRNYRAAIDETVKANLPDFFWTHFTIAAAYGQLGEQGASRAALDDLLARRPEFSRSGKEFLEKWFQPELAEHLMEGLRKAGLEERCQGSRD